MIWSWSQKGSGGSGVIESARGGEGGKEKKMNCNERKEKGEMGGRKVVKRSHLVQ